jgi:ROK family protein (putative glucokinase)
MIGPGEPAHPGAEKTDRRWAIGLDIGGTKIAAGIVARDGRVRDRQVIATPPRADAATVRRVVAELVRRLRRRHPGVTAIGVGAAGMIDWPTGHIRWAPNNAYRDLPLQQVLAADTGLPTVVENDANAAAWAEARIGAGAGYRDVIVLTVGTGVGGGFVLGGRLYRGRTGVGGEVGHLLVDPTGGQRCGCGSVGCLEALASGTALGRAGRAAARADPGGLLARLARGAESVTGETVFRAARLGDPVARALFDELGGWLGVGIASLVALFDPELVLIGGGLAEVGDLLVTPTRASFERFVFARDRRTLPPVMPARLGADAGMVGAALLALDRYALPPAPPPGRSERRRPAPRTAAGGP